MLYLYKNQIRPKMEFCSQIFLSKLWEGLNSSFVSLAISHRRKRRQSIDTLWPFPWRINRQLTFLSSLFFIDNFTTQTHHSMFTVSSRPQFLSYSTGRKEVESRQLLPMSRAILGKKLLRWRFANHYNVYVFMYKINRYTHPHKLYLFFPLRSYKRIQ